MGTITWTGTANRHGITLPSNTDVWVDILTIPSNAAVGDAACLLIAGYVWEPAGTSLFLGGSVGEPTGYFVESGIAHLIQGILIGNLEDLNPDSNFRSFTQPFGMIGQSNAYGLGSSNFNNVTTGLLGLGGMLRILIPRYIPRTDGPLQPASILVNVMLCTAILDNNIPLRLGEGVENDNRAYFPLNPGPVQYAFPNLGYHTFDQVAIGSNLTAVPPSTSPLAVAPSFSPEPGWVNVVTYTDGIAWAGIGNLSSALDPFDWAHFAVDPNSKGLPSVGQIQSLTYRRSGPTGARTYAQIIGA